MKNKILTAFILMVGFTSSAYSKYNGIFFISEYGKIKISQMELNRVVCSTDEDEANVNYKLAEYEVPKEKYDEYKLLLFNYNIVEPNGDDYVYMPPKNQQPYCYTGVQEEGIQKVMQEGSNYSRNCYTDKIRRNIMNLGDVWVTCLSGPVLKKIILIPRGLPTVEGLVLNYCPSVNIVNGIIDEQDALDCISNIDYETFTSRLN